MNKRALWKKINTEHAELLFDMYQEVEKKKGKADLTKFTKVIEDKIPLAFQVSRSPFGIDFKAEDGMINISVKQEGEFLKIVGEAEVNKPKIIN